MPIKIDGLPEIVRKLGSLDDPKVFKRPMEQSLAHLQNKLAKSPTKQPGAFSAMATPGQRRAYWARVSSGDITHINTGYRRTGTLNRKWLYRLLNGGRNGLLSNINRWATFVQGLDQQPFHEASGWTRYDKVAEDEADTVVGFFEKEYARQLKK
jgi:hypothetical protein